MTYSKNEFEIFSRQFILKEFSEEKILKLEKSLITIVGAGGIGCPLALYLISSGIKNIQIIDGDTIEKSNLNRQILFKLKDVGKKKAIVAKRELLKTNPNIQINAIDQNLNKSNLSCLLKSSIVIDTCDNWKTMKMINEYCVKKSIALISSSAVGFDLEVALFENNDKDHLCLNCIFPNKNDINLPRCETVGISGITAGFAGLIAAQKSINFLLNFKDESNILTLLNVKKGEWQNIMLKKNKKCYLN